MHWLTSGWYLQKLTKTMAGNNGRRALTLRSSSNLGLIQNTVSDDCVQATAVPVSHVDNTVASRSNYKHWPTEQLSKVLTDIYRNVLLVLGTYIFEQVKGIPETGIGFNIFSLLYLVDRGTA